MSSTNKTQNLGLNSWIGADVPKREDFNNDNTIIDSVITAHKTDAVLHITADERAAWNNGYALYTYYGDGTATRAIQLDIPFQPKWGILFAANMPLSVVDVENKVNYNYFTIFSTVGASIGAKIENKTLTVMQSTAPVMNTEFRNFNEAGTVYIAVVFR